MSRFNTKSARECLLCLLLIAAAALLICAAPSLTKLLIFVQPKTPEFKVHSSSLTITNFNVSSNSSGTITADCNATFSVNNPNSKAMFYDEIIASIMIKGRDVRGLSIVTILPFEQKGVVQEFMHAEFRNVLVLFNDSCSSTGNDKAQRLCGRAANLTMEVQARAKYRGWTWPVERDSIQVVCEDVQVDFPSRMISGPIDLGPSNCEANGHWKRMVTKWSSMFWNYIYVVGIFFGILVISL